jgi:hypothetical protein
MWAGVGDGSADETITAAIEIQKITEIGRTAYPFYRPDAAASRKDARFSGSGTRDPNTLRGARLPRLRNKPMHL